MMINNASQLVYIHLYISDSSPQSKSNYKEGNVTVEKVSFTESFCQVTFISIALYTKQFFLSLRLRWLLI